MALGLNSKSQRQLQLIPEITPGVFSGGTPLLLSNIEDDFDWQDANSFDGQRAPGDNADYWHAMIGQATKIDATLVPFYNTIGDALLQFVMPTPTGVDDATLAGVRTRIWKYPNTGRIDRKTFSAEEGLPASARRALYGLVNSVSLKCERGDGDGKCRLTTSMMGQAASEGGVLSSAGSANEVQTITLTNASGTVTIGAGGSTATFPASGTANDVRLAAESITGIGAGNVSVTGVMGAGTTSGVYTGVYTLTFINARGNTDLAQLTATVTAGTSVVATTQNGAAGSGVVVPSPFPILSNHFKLYRADTLAGLGAGSSFVGLADEWGLDLTDLVAPYWALDRTETYTSHSDGKAKMEASLMLPTDANGHCEAMRVGAKAYVSAPQWFRFEAISPDPKHQLTVDFYGSVGQNVPYEYAKNIEQRRFPITLLRSPDGFPLRFTTKQAI